MECTKNRCQYCGHIIDKREIALFDGMVYALWRVFEWCSQKEIHEFCRKDIEHCLIGGNEKARFGDWVMFGGLVYKRAKGHYGLNMERCDNFFSNKLKIPSRIWKDPITGGLDMVDYKTMREIPGLVEFLDNDGSYKARYSERQQLTL